MGVAQPDHAHGAGRISRRGAGHARLQYQTSDAPQDVSAYDLDTLAADVAALAEACRSNRFHMVGHDWGAVIGW